MLKRLNKANYSEWVVRNALYWLTPTSPWTLDEDGDSWLVQVQHGSFDVDAELNRLLNDYVLREQLMAETRLVRDAIAKAVLKSINARVSDEC